MSIQQKHIWVGLILCLSLFLSACSSISYYRQSVIGHSRIMLARQSIDQLLNQPGLNEELKQQLELVVELRQFSIDRLSLANNDSYLYYVDLKREYPVWTVVAAEEFSIDAKSWCYPIIGCATYRGYFSEKAAHEYAASLAVVGYEISVSGVSAYSTLGWFDDPILPSMLRYGEINLAEIIFHELAHQQLYINGDSDFNEAFATVVGEQGTVMWLKEAQPELLDDYLQKLKVRNNFSRLILNVKSKLEVLYSSDVSINEMREQKELIFNGLVDDYKLLKSAKWGNVNWFDGWFEQTINNARLAGFATYRDHVPVILKLFESCNFDFDKFYQKIKTIEFDNIESQDKIDLLSKAECVE